VSPEQTIALLTLIGFLLLAAEVFVPGMILGALGFLCLCVGVAYSYAAFGPITGTLSLVGIFGVTLIGFVAWMFAFPHTAIGRRIMLHRSQPQGRGGNPENSTSLLGKSGVALTLLRPAGTARIDGRKIDVVAEGPLIDRDARIVVVAEEGMRVVVREDLPATPN
jgi:membrane-bound serine protease (ClpP class)